MDLVGWLHAMIECLRSAQTGRLLGGPRPSLGQVRSHGGDPAPSLQERRPAMRAPHCARCRGGGGSGAQVLVTEKEGTVDRGSPVKLGGALDGLSHPLLGDVGSYVLPLKPRNVGMSSIVEPALRGQPFVSWLFPLTRRHRCDE